MAQIAALRQPDAFAGQLLTNSVSYDSWPIPSVKMMQRLAPVLSRLPATLIYPTMVQLLHRGHDNRQRAIESIGEHWCFTSPRRGKGPDAPSRSAERKGHQRDLRTASHAGTAGTGGLGEADGSQKIEFIRIPNGKHFTPEDHPETIA